MDNLIFQCNYQHISSKVYALNDKLDQKKHTDGSGRNF